MFLPKHCLQLNPQNEGTAAASLSMEVERSGLLHPFEFSLSHILTSKAYDAAKSSHPPGGNDEALISCSSIQLKLNHNSVPIAQWGER
jgi:hypothetical protein